MTSYRKVWLDDASEDLRGLSLIVSAFFDLARSWPEAPVEWARFAAGYPARFIAVGHTFEVRLVSEAEDARRVVEEAEALRPRLPPVLEPGEQIPAAGVWSVEDDPSAEWT